MIRIDFAMALRRSLSMASASSNFSNGIGPDGWHLDTAMLLLLSQPFEGGHFRTWYVAMRFLAVQLFAAIAIALASDFLPPGTPRANEMEATYPLV